MLLSKFHINFAMTRVVDAEEPLCYAILHKGLEHSQTLVSASILERGDNCILLCHLTCYNGHSFLLCLERQR